MATLWTFGDSHTAGDGCLKHLPIRNCGTTYFDEYKEPDSDIWPTLLGRAIGCHVKNLGRSGASNDYILDSIIDNFDMIEPDDIVIIGKSFHQRFDIPDLIENRFNTQYAEAILLNYKDLKSGQCNRNEVEIETILNYCVLFSDHSLFKERQDKRFNFIKKQLSNKVSKLLMWGVGDTVLMQRIETILQHTKGKVKDGHFSYNGHKLLSEIFYKKIFEKHSLL